MCRRSIGLPRYFGFAAKHLHIFGHHSQAGTLLAGLFVVPGIEAEMTFDEDLAPFLRNSCATSVWRPQSVTSTKTVSSFFEPSSFFMTRFTAIPMSARVPFGVYLGCGSRVRFPGKKTLLRLAIYVLLSSDQLGYPLQFRRTPIPEGINCSFWRGYRWPVTRLQFLSARPPSQRPNPVFGFR
jgi:hypothetical protein